MSDLVQETFEHHEHLEHHPDDTNARRSALLIGVLAAVLAVSEMAERSSQNAYLVPPYRGQQRIRLLPGPPDPRAGADAIGRADDGDAADAGVAAGGRGGPGGGARRLTDDSDRGNGAKQIQARADAEGQCPGRRRCTGTSGIEIVTSALQIAIVLASVSVVTRLAAVSWLGAGLGVLAAGLAGLVAAGLV